MSGLSFVMLAVVAVLSLGAQPPKVQPKPKPTPTPSPSTAKVVEVEIIVASLEAHQKSCKAGGVRATTILVAGKAVRHCVKGVLLDHDVDETKNPEAFKQTVVYVSAGQSIRWFSKATSFRVVQVRRHAPMLVGAPAYPFLGELPTQFSNEVTSGTVLDLAYEVVQRYKISFEIGKPGNRVDPDVVCSM